MLINSVLRMAEKQRLGKSNTKVKCKEKNIPENVKTLKKHKGRSRWFCFKLQMRSKK